MKIEELEKELETHDMEYRGFCHDCHREVVINAKVNEEGAITISGGAIYKIKINLEDRYFFKCDDCFEEDRVLKNYRECEVYSRVVGYLRPIGQWNNGKKVEYDMRKEYKNLE